MSRLTTPLLHRIVWATGDVLLRAELILAIKADQGRWERVDFLVDSGSEISTMPGAEARRLGIPMPQQASPGVDHRATGLEIRAGYLRFQVLGMDATEYVVPCYFLGDPNQSTGIVPSTPVSARSLLGLSGVVDKLRLTFDGVGSPGAAYGHLLVEKQ
jgi:hypothetical protein